MRIYEKNLNFFEKKFPDLRKTLEAVPGRKCKTEKAKNGSLTLVYSHNDTTYYLHSKFNPRAESAKIIANKNTDASHIVVLGLGLGYHLEKILETKNRLSRVLLIEPDWEIIKHSLETLDWEKLSKRNDFDYAFGTDFNDITGKVHSFINIITFDTLEFIELPSETRILGPFFAKAREVVENEIKTNLYDFRTRLAESYMLPRNVLKNLQWILKTRPVARLKNCFTGTPGFIVSA